MDRDAIARVEIDSDRRLHVVPASQEFPFIYRAGMEVGWDADLRSLHSPKPRDWSYMRWFQQILAAAAEEYGCKLVLTDDTAWVNVDPGTKAGLLGFSGHGA